MASRRRTRDWDLDDVMLHFHVLQNLRAICLFFSTLTLVIDDGQTRQEGGKEGRQKSR